MGAKIDAACIVDTDNWSPLSGVERALGGTIRPAMQTISVIDCETTGLGNADRVFEIAVVTLDARTLVTTDEFDPHQ
jgi:DNA polymerase III epsilon subunit-like protein